MLSQEIFVTPNSSRSWSILSSTTVPRASSSLLWKMTVASVLGSLPPYCNQLLLSEVHMPSEQAMSLRVNLKLLSLVYRCSLSSYQLLVAMTKSMLVVVVLVVMMVVMTIRGMVIMTGMTVMATVVMTATTPEVEP